MDAKQEIIRLRQYNPLMNGVEIAGKVGVCKQYVSKVLKAEGLITFVPRPRKLPRQCDLCGYAIPKRQRFCSSECRETYLYLLVTCAFCHISFPRRRSDIALGHRRGYNAIYCNRICFNKGQKDR